MIDAVERYYRVGRWKTLGTRLKESVKKIFEGFLFAAALVAFITAVIIHIFIL